MHGLGTEAVLNVGRQDRHIEGRATFDAARSTLTVDPVELLERYAGRGQPVGSVERGCPGFKERFDTGSFPIGVYKDAEGKVSIATSCGIIHYGRRGAHIVPARPSATQEARHD